MTDRYEKNINKLSHEIWAVAQLAPGEGIADGVARIKTILRRAIHPAITHCERCGCSWLDDGLNPIGCPYCEKIDWHAVNAELLPLPVGEASSFGNYEVHDNEAMVAYARANVARAVAPLQAERDALAAEVERLRAEVERFRTDGASAVRWAPGSAYWSEVLKELFGPDARKGIDILERRGQAALERADKTVQIVDAKPARLHSKRVSLDGTDRVFEIINRFRDQPGTRFKGVRIEIGEGENTVTVRFQEREVTAAMIEGVVNNLRAVLNEPEALVNIAIAEGIQFETGFALKEFAKIAGVELKPGDVSQEE